MNEPNPYASPQTDPEPTDSFEPGAMLHALKAWACH